jgi:hypothetical protein
MNDLSGLEGAATPYLPLDVVRRTAGIRTSFDICGITSAGVAMPLRELRFRDLVDLGPANGATQLGQMFWLWWKTLSGSYVVFTFTSRS